MKNAMWLSMFLALPLGACGVSQQELAEQALSATEGEASRGEAPRGGDAAGVCGAPALAINDCPLEQGYRVSTYQAPDGQGPELVVFGIYESRGDHGTESRPVGSASVVDRRTTPHVLVLSSYEPTKWTVRLEPGARPERIILNGYHPQHLAFVPEGVEVEDRSGPERWLGATPFSWPSDAPREERPMDPLEQERERESMLRFISNLEQLTSRRVTAFAGCYRATDFTLEDSTEACTPPPSGTAGPVLHEAQCTEGQGRLSTHVASTLGSPELHVVGVYESHSQHSADSHPEGSATVEVARSAPVILALSSYEPIHWQVRVAPGTRVERIILNGYHPQRVTAPEGIPVENRSGPERWLGTYGYAWPSSEGGSDTPRLVAELERLAGTPLSSFAGCYQGTAFKIGEGRQVPPQEPAPRPTPGPTACEGLSGPGTYKGYFCEGSHNFIRTQGIACQSAYDNCVLNADSNPRLSVACLWDGHEIYRRELAAGVCDGLAGRTSP